jgi:hypothetical protein
MIGFTVTAIIGLIMLISSQNPHVKYAGCFFFGGGIYPNVPQGVAWNGNNIGGSVKRAVGIAMHVGFGESCGVDFFSHPRPMLTPCLYRQPGRHRLRIHLLEQRLSQVHQGSRHSHWVALHERLPADLHDHLPPP